MRYPNLRYGNPEALRYYASYFGDSTTYIKNLARYLKRDERTVQRWLDGKLRVPWWVPELLRLRWLENCDVVRQMTGHNLKRLAVVDAAGVYHFHTSAEIESRMRKRENPPVTSLCLDDFDTPAPQPARPAPSRKRKTAPAKAVQVSDEDIYNWVAAVSPRHLTEREYAPYVRRWDVAGKVRQAKIDGRFDDIIAERKPAFKPF